MSRADFYLIAKDRFKEQPLLLVCELARKATQQGLWTLILARDSSQAEALDDLLWSFDPDAYIPHQLVSDEDDDVTPVLIASPSDVTPMRPLVINLRDGAVEGSFERVLEVVPDDESAREPLRERWREYKQRGFVSGCARCRTWLRLATHSRAADTSVTKPADRCVSPPEWCHICDMPSPVSRLNSAVL